jgi:hypothetical protein
VVLGLLAAWWPGWCLFLKISIEELGIDNLLKNSVMINDEVFKL